MQEVTTTINGDIILGLFGLLLLLIIILLTILVVNNKRIHNVTYPVYDYIVKGARAKADKITGEAMDSSRKMIADAEAEGLKIVAKERTEVKKIEDAYDEQLKALMNDTQNHLKQYVDATDADMKRLSEAVEKRIATGISKNEAFLQSETTKLSEQLTNTFTTLEANAKEQIRANVEQELVSVKNVVETYRQERFALIDNQILALIENTSQLALQKTLSLEDHTDLLYQSLEEAKANNDFS